MNVYLEEAGRSHLRKNIKIFEKALSNDESLNLHIIFKRKLGLLELILILRKFKKISSLELIIEPQNISIPIIRFVNSNKKIGIVFIANKELNTNALGRIERCKGIVRIYDNVSQEINVKNQRNLLIARDNIDDIRIATAQAVLNHHAALFRHYRGAFQAHFHQFVHDDHRLARVVALQLQQRHLRHDAFVPRPFWHYPVRGVRS